eukprot:Gb_20230 [translate_table: standard]
MQCCSLIVGHSNTICSTIVEMQDVLRFADGRHRRRRENGCRKSQYRRRRRTDDRHRRKRSISTPSENPGPTSSVSTDKLRADTPTPTDLGRSHRRRNQSPTPTEPGRSRKSLSENNSVDFVDDRQDRAVAVKRIIWSKVQTDRKEPAISFEYENSAPRQVQRADEQLMPVPLQELWRTKPVRWKRRETLGAEALVRWEESYKYTSLWSRRGGVRVQYAERLPNCRASLMPHPLARSKPQRPSDRTNPKILFNAERDGRLPSRLLRQKH